MQHVRVCVRLTRQSVASGPVQPAAQWALQQSLGLGPRQRRLHWSAHCSLVSAQKKREREIESHDLVNLII